MKDELKRETKPCFQIRFQGFADARVITFWHCLKEKGFFLLHFQGAPRKERMKRDFGSRAYPEADPYC